MSRKREYLNDLVLVPRPTYDRPSLAILQYAPMAKKLNFDSAWIGLQQELEKQNGQ